MGSSSAGAIPPGPIDQDPPVSSASYTASLARWHSDSRHVLTETASQPLLSTAYRLCAQVCTQVHAQDPWKSLLIAEDTSEAHPAQVRLPPGQAGEGDADRAGAGGDAVGSLGDGVSGQRRRPGAARLPGLGNGRSAPRCRETSGALRFEGEFRREPGARAVGTGGTRVPGSRSPCYSTGAAAPQKAPACAGRVFGNGG